MRTETRQGLIEVLFFAVLLFATNLRGMSLSQKFVPLWLSLVEATFEVALVLIAAWTLRMKMLEHRYAELWAASWPAVPLLVVACL